MRQTSCIKETMCALANYLPLYCVNLRIDYLLWSHYWLWLEFCCIFPKLCDSGGETLDRKPQLATGSVSYSSSTVYKQ